jgi:hypothetical protein
MTKRFLTILVASVFAIGLSLSCTPRRRKTTSLRGPATRKLQQSDWAIYYRIFLGSLKFRLHNRNAACAINRSATRADKFGAKKILTELVQRGNLSPGQS